MNILKSFCQKLWQGLKNGLLRFGKGIVNVSFHMLLILLATIGIFCAAPFTLLAWFIPAAIAYSILTFAFGLEVSFFAVSIVLVLICAIAGYFIVQKRFTFNLRAFPRR